MKAIYLTHENIPCFIFLPRLLISCKIYSEKWNSAPYRQGNLLFIKYPLQIKAMLGRKKKGKVQLNLKPGLNNKNEEQSYGKAAIHYIGHGYLCTLYIVHLKFKKMKCFCVYINVCMGVTLCEGPTERSLDTFHYIHSCMIQIYCIFFVLSCFLQNNNSIIHVCCKN